MNVSDYLGSLNDQFREKFNSPLLFSFSLSWAAWNYKIFFILLSDLKPTEKFDLVSGLYADASVLWGGALLYPALSTFAYLIAYPVISRELLRYSLWQQDITQKMKAKSLAQKIMLPSEIKELRLRYEERINAAEAEADRKTDLSVRYKAERDKSEQSLIDERAELSNALTDARNKLAEAEIVRDQAIKDGQNNFAAVVVGRKDNARVTSELAEAKKTEADLIALVRRMRDDMDNHKIWHKLTSTTLSSYGSIFHRLGITINPKSTDYMDFADSGVAGDPDK